MQPMSCSGQVTQTKAESIKGRRTLALGVGNPPPPPTSALKFRLSGPVAVSKAKPGFQEYRPARTLG